MEYEPSVRWVSLSRTALSSITTPLAPGAAWDVRANPAQAWILTSANFDCGATLRSLRYGARHRRCDDRALGKAFQLSEQALLYLPQSMLLQLSLTLRSESQNPHGR